MTSIVLVMISILLLFGGEACSKKEEPWPPRNGKHDAEAETITPGSEVELSIPKDAPVTSRGIETIIAGKFMPAKGSYEITGGEFISKLDRFIKTATFSTWTYIYKDPIKKEISGWGPCLTSGEVLLPNIFLLEGPKDQFIENSFEVVDFGRDFSLVKLDPLKGHRLCVQLTSGLKFIVTAAYQGTKVSVNGKLLERKLDGWYKGDQLVSKQE